MNLDKVTKAAHVLVDVLSTYDPDSNDPDHWQGPLDAAIPRLLDMGAVEIRTVEPVQFEVGIYDLVLAASVALEYLTAEVATVRGVHRDSVIVDLRAWIDEVARHSDDEAGVEAELDPPAAS